MADSRHLVDPELLPFLEQFPKFCLSMQNLQIVREAARQPSSFLHKCDNAVDVTRRIVPGPSGAPHVEVAIYRPHKTEKPLPCILHMHGGGYVLGSPEQQREQHRAMAAELSCCIVSVNYRLAPEAKFPGAIEDCYATLIWIFANALALRIDTARVGVMGESAGGGLAAALALLARDRGGPPLAFQHLIYPMIDDRTCIEADPHPYAGEFVWTPQNNHFGWSALLGVVPGADRVSEYAAAARAHDLSRLPPAFISTGSLDLFVEENIEYARRLTRAGVPVELHVFPGAFHGFDFDPSAAVAVQARSCAMAALERALRPR